MVCPCFSSSSSLPCVQVAGVAAASSGLDLVYTSVGVAEGEADPNCLMQVFHIVQVCVLELTGTAS